MKTLTQLNEDFKISSKTQILYDDKYFIYNHTDDNHVGFIRIFFHLWPLFKQYNNNVYINDKHIRLDKTGYTVKSFKPGVYKIEIKDIDGITDCENMFHGCKELVNVPKFDTSNIETTFGMFLNCESLVYVPLFNIPKIQNMGNMFSGCDRLNIETKRQWSQIYDFNKHDMIDIKYV